MSRNQDIVILTFWSTTKLEVEGSQPVRPKISKWVFLMSSLWLIELRTSNGLECESVELILSTFEDLPSVSDQGR